MKKAKIGSFHKFRVYPFNADLNMIRCNRVDWCNLKGCNGLRGDGKRWNVIWELPQQIHAKRLDFAVGQEKKVIQK